MTIGERLNGAEISQASLFCALPPANPFTDTPRVLLRPNDVQAHFCEPVVLIDKNPEPGVPEGEQELKLKLRLDGSMPSPVNMIVFVTAPMLAFVIVPLNTPAAAGANRT